MNLLDSSFVLNYGHSFWKIPSKLNGYECTCHAHMRTLDACLYSSVTTVSPMDIPQNQEELIAYIAKLKSEIDVLSQAFSFVYALYKLNQNYSAHE